MTSAHFFNGRTDNGHSTVLAAVALALAGTIFYIDTFTNIEGAIAVLYVIALLLLGDILTPRGHVTACMAAVGLAAASYVYAHSDALIDLQSLLRLSVALAALVITTSLLMRNEASRSELIATNAALRESESRYRAIFERTKVALWERDYSSVREILLSLKAQGVDDLREYARQQPEIIDRCVAAVRTVAANEAAVELLGRNAIDQTPGSLRRILPPGDETFLDLMEAIFQGRRSFSDSVTVVGDDGERKLVLLTVSFPEDPTAFNRVVTGMVDITQRELAQKALQDARAELAASSRTAAIGALSTSLAHELNQPLGAIIVSAQTLVRWLDRDPPDLAAAKRATDRIVRDGERASEIIKQTRSRIEQTQSEPTSVDLVHLVEETCAIMDAEFDGHRVKHKIITSKSVPQVIAMRIELQQVLINLVTNAIQALANSRQANPQVNIEVRPGDGDQVVISVADNGPGIPEDAVDKLFAPFFTTKETGMGIGLSVCKSFVEAIGGRLTARNNSSGGAVFELSLPLVGTKKHDAEYA